MLKKIINKIRHKNIKNYIVVMSLSSTSLEEKVTDKLKEGFMPVGGICMTRQRMLSNVEQEYAQAMVK